MTIFEQLAAPFDPDRVSWRVGATSQDKSKGLALAYIDARDVMHRLDEVAGPGGWQNDYPHANGKTVCRIGIKVGEEWIWKSNGAGDSDVEAEKGALSDAFKRAAVMWGIGRYLYDVPSTWVAIEPMGKSFKIRESEYAKLRNVLGGSRKQAAPAASNAVLDHTAHATDLIAELKRWKQASALEQWGKSQGIKDLIAGLDEANRMRVRTAYAAHLKSLTETVLA
jgi:hypothetical protein